MPVVSTASFPSASDAMQLIRAMLADADAPMLSTITPAGAVRASTVTTITTSADHGLQPGAVVQIASVSNTTFNGTQTVVNVPTPTSFTYSQPFQPNATSGNGTVTLIVQGDIYTDSVLLPFVNKAYRKVQSRLFENSTQGQKTETIITLPIGTTDLLDTTSPALPVDFLAPITLEERISGNPYFNLPMPMVDELPSQQQTTYNGVYAWWEDGLHFVGALAALDLRLRYTVGFPYLATADSVITIRGCLDLVADYGAMLAANSRGAANASVFAGLFEEDMKEFLNTQAKAQQVKPARRRPNNLGRRGLRSFGLSR